MLVRKIAKVSNLLARNMATETAATSMVLNFVTPHTIVYKNKQVEKVTLPGEAGQYGVTVGHSPIISQLAAGVVTVVHTTGESEEYFIPGGFAITHANSVTDLSVTEAFNLNDFEPSLVKSGYDAAKQAEASASDPSAKVTAEIQVTAYGNLARALGISL